MKLVEFHGGPLDGDLMQYKGCALGMHFVATEADGIKLEFPAIYVLEKRGTDYGFFHTGYQK